MKLDETLVARACGGDEAAAAQLMRAVWPDAYRIAWSVLRQHSMAEDAAQEACDRAWSGLHALRKPEGFAVWFYRIVANESKRVIDARRRELFQRVAPLRCETPLDDRVAVRAAVDALEPRLRVPVLLRYYYGLRSREIAQVLGVSAVTVRWRLMLAHRRLASALDAEASRTHSKTPSDGRYKDESIAAS